MNAIVQTKRILPEERAKIWNQVTGKTVAIGMITDESIYPITSKTTTTGHAMLGQADEGSAHQGGQQPHLVIGEKGIQKGEHQAYQEIGNQSAQPDDELVEGLDADGLVDVVAAEYDGGNPQCGEDEHGPYQSYAQIVTEPPGLGANAGYVPNGVEGLFHPREQRDDGPEQEGNAEGAQNGEVEIAHIGQGVAADLGTLLSQWLQ